MSVALPPPLPPQQSDIAALRAAAERGSAELGDYRMHVLSDETGELCDWRAVVARSETPSEAVRGLSRACYDAGYLSARIHYALEGRDLYVLIDYGTLVEVSASPPLARYFDGLPVGGPLEAALLEPRRILAEAHAGRAGLDAALSLQPVAAGQRLAIDALGESGNATRFGASLANTGNRFVGRHFADFEVIHQRPSGNRIAARLNVGLRNLNDDPSVDRYAEETVAWSRVTPAGLFGLTAHVIDYGSSAEEADVDGDLNQWAARWEYPLAASLASRWILESGVDYTDNRKRGGSAPRQEERYLSVEPGLVFVHYADWIDRSWALEAGVRLRAGLGPHRSGQTAARLDYLAWRPRVRVGVQFDDRTRAALAVSAQLGSDSVPEQEQWVLGGINALYAYLPGVAVGDGGALVLLQVESRVLDHFGIDLRPRVFAEYGLAYVNGAADGADRVTLADAGIEVNARLSPHIAASVGTAVPFCDDDLDAGRRHAADANVLFRLSVSF